MKSTIDMLTDTRNIKMAEEMSVITFGELIMELTGKPIEVIFKGYLTQGEINE